MAQMSGVFGVYKPRNVLSTAVLTRIKSVLAGVYDRPPKLGHGGTLDAEAQGVLVVGLNRGTKCLPKYLNSSDKIYLVRAKLGETTASLDRDMRHPLTYASADHVTLEMMNAELAKYRGSFMQKPPLFSAVKVGGKRAGELASRGGEPVLSAKPVCVTDLKLLSFEPPFFQLHVACTSGFYVRSLVRDLAADLKTVGICEEIERSQCGDMSDKDCIPFDQLSVETISRSIRRCPEMSEVERQGWSDRTREPRRRQARPFVLEKGPGSF